MPAAKKTTERVRLKPADPFDLIRLIARSQADPKKAIAELVQNSFDAGASSIRVTRFTHQGRRSLSVYDNGHGVFAELERAEALRRIATTIGRSYKAKLTAAERHRQMTLGKYGIGLLGFWSVGRVMEIRSRVHGSDTWVLRLQEEVRDGEVFRMRSARLPAEETFTEIIISEVHPGAEPQLQLRRLAAFLAGEMRGQLLQRDVQLELFDRVARGLAQKRLAVKPRRFQGIPISECEELTVEGCAPARVELYLVQEEEGRRGAVALACGGATVLDDLSLVEGVDAPREPWSSGRFEGVVDFPDFEVAPGTRRGFVPNDASVRFIAALGGLEARCREILAQDLERRREEREADDVKDLRRVFRKLPLSLPQYSLFTVRDGRSGLPAEIESGQTVGEAREAASRVGEAEAAPVPIEGFLFPPGPLAIVEVRPRRSELSPGAERKLQARAFDGDRRPLDEEMSFEWSVEGAGSVVATANPRQAMFAAPDHDCETTVRVRVRQGSLAVDGIAEIRVSSQAPLGDGDYGVPDPQPVSMTNESWRSRVLEGQWQYNTGHADYRRVQDDPRRRLRYLVHLFAKEVVLRNFGDPGDGAVLERMVEVLTHVGETLPRKGPAKSAES